MTMDLRIPYVNTVPYHSIELWICDVFLSRDEGGGRGDNDATTQQRTGSDKTWGEVYLRGGYVYVCKYVRITFVYLMACLALLLPGSQLRNNNRHHIQYTRT